MDDFLRDLKAAYSQDPESQQFLKPNRQGSSPFYLQHGYIVTTNSTGTRLYIPANGGLRQRLLKEYHDSNLAGHLGMDKTYECLSRHYFWPTMRTDVREYVRTCPSCQANKGTNTKPIGVLNPLPIPARKWEQTTTDLITQLPKTSRGHDAIAVFVDKLTKMVHIVPTVTKVTAPQFARLYFDNVVRLHGLQRSIVSDRDPRFTSKFWEALTKLCGTNLARSTAYHPQTDGQTERANRTLEEILRAYVDARQHDWDLHLTAAEFAINNAPSVSTGQSPFYLNYGYHPLTPATIELDPIIGNQGAIDFMQRWEQDLSRAKQLLQQAQERQKKFADQRRQDHVFKSGDNVMLSSANLNIPGGSKFTARWLGPFKVLDVISPVALRLALPSTMKIHPVIHVSRLKPYHSSDSYPGRDYSRPTPIIGEDIYLAERILDKRLVKRGKQQRAEYLVQWQGYPIYEATWEPASNLLGDDIRRLMADFDATWQPKAQPRPTRASSNRLRQHQA